MTDHLDQLLARLAAAPPDRRLDQVEPAVWARIDQARRPIQRGAIWGWRAALAAAMLTAGAFASGGAAAVPKESSPFAIHSALAPSTLLEGDQ